MKKSKIFCAIFVLLGFTIAFAEQLNIEAKRLYSDEKKGMLIAEGSVHITKEKDSLDANKVILYTKKQSNDQRKPDKFEAIENVNFTIFTEDGRELRGKCGKLIYFVEIDEYHLLANAQVREIGKPNFIKGEKIIINRNSGLANIESNSNAPARVTIDLNDMQDSKKKNNR